MHKGQIWLGSLVTTAALCAGTPSMANVLPFTWDPAGAAPPLAGPGAAFTADAMSFDNHVYGVVQPNGSFVSHRLVVITGFSLNGAAVTPAGFGSSYGLYFDVAETGVSAPPMPLIFSSSNITLKADPGNLDGAALATSSGVGFANTGATGAMDDITLGTGAMVTGTASLNPATGVRTTHFVDTFASAPGEAGFFLAPVLGSATFLDFLATTNPGLLQITPGPGGTVIQTINGSTGVAQFVPEPGSIVLLGIGLLGLAPLLRRSRRHGLPLA